MKLEIPIIVGFDDMKSLLDDLKKLQTYKLFEGDEMVLVDIEDVAKVLMDHVKAKKSVKSDDMVSRKSVYDALECMRFVSDEERRYGFSLLEQIPTAQPEVRTQMSLADCISRADALSCFHDWIDQRGDVHTADEMPEFQRIEQLPSAQPEQPEIIRCKDCKHQTVFHYTDKRFKDPDRYVYGCDLMEDGCFLDCYDSYCSEAEGRTDE